jgi:hypothetical protein
MQLVANQQLVKNRSRLGLGFLLASFACLLLAVMATLQFDARTEFSIAPYLVMVVGLVLYTIGMSQLRRWGPRNRQDEALAKEIRALDERYKMYAFLSSSLPDYILVSPAGVHVLIPRQDSGEVACVRDKWNVGSRGGFVGRLFGNSAGDPTADASTQLEKVRKFLDEAGLQDVPTSSVIVFTHPKVHLRVEGCSSNIARTSKLEEVVRRMAGKGRNVALTTARIREIQRVFDDRMRAAHSWR